MSEIKKAPEETAEDTLPAAPTQLTGIAFAKAAVLNRGRGGSLNRRTLRTGVDLFPENPSSLM